MTKEIFLHGCNKINCTILNNNPDSFIKFNNQTLPYLTQNTAVNLLKLNRVTEDLLCINYPSLFSTYRLDTKYIDIFKKPKVRYGEQYLDFKSYLKLIDKQSINELEFEEIPDKLQLSIKGAYNQIIEFYSLHNNTNVIISTVPHKLEVDDEVLFNTDFVDIYYHYPYIWVGKLSEPISFDVRDDLTLFISIYSNPQNFRVKLYYNKLYPTIPVRTYPLQNSKFNSIKKIICFREGNYNLTDLEIMHRIKGLV